MKTKGNLPLFGVGPYYILFSFSLTFFSIYYTNSKSFIYYLPSFSLLFKIFSLIFIILAIVLWISAVFFNRISSKIKQNQLVTTGAYSYVRHPIYSSFLLVHFAILLINGNVMLFPLLVIHWLILSLLLINTEEKWLLQRYPNEYLSYSKHVNRCIPWFPLKKEK